MMSSASGAGEVLFAKLKSSKRLPSPPGTAIRVLELCRRDDVDVGEIADVIMSDAALTARLLKYANSPMAGLSREVTAIRQAVMLLGLRTVKLTALGFSLAGPSKAPNCPGFSLKVFWASSFLRAVIARRLAAKPLGVDPDEAFTAALLAGLGQLTLAHALNDEYSVILNVHRKTKTGLALVEIEREKLGSDHVEIGARLLREWRLPDQLSYAVEHQHLDMGSGRPQAPEQRLGAAIHVANRLRPLFEAMLQGRAKCNSAAPEDILNLLQLDEEAYWQAGDAVVDDYKGFSQIFDVEFEDPQDAMELCLEAQETATHVGMVAQLEHSQALKDNESLLKRATTDQLTGVANRAKFDERLREELAGLGRGHGQFALLMIDIDHFKKFNDTHGHPIGDLVLKRVATAMQNTVREADLMARYGGEEFAVIAPHTDVKGACITAVRLQRCIAELRIDVGGTLLGVTISLGLAVTSDYAMPPTAEQFIKDADRQLYLSKKAGRNTWSYRGCSANRAREKAKTAPVPVA
ncbi:MAG: GGDEF domain-containing protein [Planctomycetota bacterium]